MIRLRNFLFLTVTLCISIPLLSQSVEGLKKKKEKIYKELKLSNNILKETRNNKQSSVKELKLLKEQLKTREELVNTLKDELSITDTSIVRLASEIEVKQQELDLQKEEYAKMIRYAYTNRSKHNVWLFLFSANTFNDAFRRIQYIRQYNRYRITQVEKIEVQKDTINSKIEALEEKKTQKSIIIEEETLATEQLEKERIEKNKLLEDLQKKEEKLNDEITQKQISLASLENEITSIIQKNIKEQERKRKAKEAVKAAEKVLTAKNEPKTKTSAPTITKKSTSSPSKLSSGFSNNKGRLPWPVDGIITGNFGKGRHSEASAVEINNTGIDISTTKGSKVKVVFEGEVTNIIYSPVFQSAVIVKHGKYFSVYSNLENVFVSKGEKVNTNQVIGTVSSSNDGKTEMHFEVWNGINKLNPSRWLARK